MVPRLERMSRSVMAGQIVRAEGRLGGGRRSRRMLLETRAGGRWHTVAEAGTSRRGRFRLSWRPAGPGHYTVRARPKRGLAPQRVRSRTVTVYRQALASWFGPGLYGRRTACGQALHPGLLGVAHKGLPCGTRVTFAYGARRVTVPVIDRGPFVGNREWDLTAATRQRLGFPSTGLVLSSR